MNKVLETAILKDGRALLLSQFVTDLGNTFFAITWVAPNGKVVNSWSYSLNFNGDMYCRELFDSEKNK